MEHDIECAVREFREETGISDDRYQLVSRVKQYIEDFQGTNDVSYRHSYFLGYANEYFPVWYDSSIPSVAAEIRNIGWFTYDECMSLIRPYHDAKRKLLTNLHRDIGGT